MRKVVSRGYKVMLDLLAFRRRKEAVGSLRAALEFLAEAHQHTAVKGDFEGA